MCVILKYESLQVLWFSSDESIKTSLETAEVPKVAGLLIDRWRSLVKAASKNLHDLQFKKWIGNNDSGWPPIKCRQKLKAAITILEAGNNNSGWLPLLGGANSSRIARRPKLKPQHSPISKWWWGLVICNTTWVVGWGRDISSGLNILDIFDIERYCNCRNLSFLFILVGRAWATLSI